MAVALLLAMQALGIVDPTGFDLRRLPVPNCPTAKGDEIIVCGNVDRNERFRLRPLDSTFEPKPLRAEATLGDAKLDAATEHIEIGPGLPSNRIMLHVKIPL